MELSKFSKESLTIMTNIVLPNNTNALNNLFGGELLARMDRACAIAAARHSESQVVTASVNHVSFEMVIPLGSIIVIEAKVSRSFTSSMEVYVDVWLDDPIKKIKTKANEAIYTFVAVDSSNKPIKVPKVIPETELEKTRFDGALRRKQLSLILSNRMMAKEATELKKLFS